MYSNANNVYTVYNANTNNGVIFRKAPPGPYGGLSFPRISRSISEAFRGLLLYSACVCEKVL